MAGAEAERLEQDARRERNWKRWGPYLSERQWGTVREDYSRGRRRAGTTSRTTTPAAAPTAGARTACSASPTASAGCASRSRCGTGSDPILKERLFGLTGPEGNHGEDVKECYYYLDSTPTHSYMKALYKYPQARVSLRAAGRGEPRGAARADPEFELADTGVFDDDRYFDVFAEYAKAAPDDMLIRITVANRGPGAGDAARAADALVPQHLVAGAARTRAAEPKPRIDARRPTARSSPSTRRSARYRLRRRRRPDGDAAELLFTENETNVARLFGAPNAAAAT